MPQLMQSGAVLNNHTVRANNVTRIKLPGFLAGGLAGVVIELLCEAGRYSGAWPPVQVLSGDRIPITPSGSFADLRIVTIWLMAVDLFIQAHDISHTTGSDFGAWVSPKSPRIAQKCLFCSLSDSF